MKNLIFNLKMVTAVGVVHDCGIIHRDLKPCNFVLVQGEVKLIDFGIANSIETDVTRCAHSLSVLSLREYF